MAPCQVIHQLGLLQRHGAEDDAIEAAGQQLLGSRCRAHAAPQLHGDVEGGGDRLHHSVVHRLTGAGAIEIDQMQPLCPLALPVQRLGHRIVAEARHLVVIALVEPHAVAVEQVDGGNDLHGGRRGQRLPARLPEAPIPQLQQRHHDPEAGLKHGRQLCRPLGAAAALTQKAEVPVAAAAGQDGRLCGVGRTGAHARTARCAGLIGCRGHPGGPRPVAP